MTDVVCDASIVLKWFHDEGEPDTEGPRRLLAAHRAGTLIVNILDLTFYEIGNVLIRALRWPATQAADQLDDLRDLCAVLVPGPAELRLAFALAELHGLTMYDSVYAATARHHGAVLATADRELLKSALGQGATAIADRLGLPVSRGVQRSSE